MIYQALKTIIDAHLLHLGTFFFHYAIGEGLAAILAFFGLKTVQGLGLESLVFFEVIVVNFDDAAESAGFSFDGGITTLLTLHFLRRFRFQRLLLIILLKEIHLRLRIRPLMRVGLLRVHGWLAALLLHSWKVILIDRQCIAKWLLLVTYYLVSVVDFQIEVHCLLNSWAVAHSERLRVLG